MEQHFLNAAFWMLTLCCIRMIVYMKMHPSISSITETFISVGRELVNFLFSFGVIFAFLAYIAHVRCPAAIPLAASLLSPWHPVQP